MRSPGAFLEIGCFSGSDYTLDLVKAAGNYTGVELSKAACVSLRRKIAENGAGDRATVVCGDFLEFQPGRKFDLIYAHGVLHHFQNPEPLFARIRDLIATMAGRCSSNQWPSTRCFVRFVPCIARFNRTQPGNGRFVTRRSVR